MYAAVAARASNNSIYAPVAPLPAAVAAYLYPDAALQRAAAPALRAFRAAAGPLLKRGRGDKAEELLAGRRLYKEEAAEGGSSGADADAASAQVEAAAATVSKRARKAAAGEDEAGAEAAAAAESADALLAAKALDAGVFNVGGGGGGGGGAGGGGGRRATIGTGDPVGDFTAALRGGRASEEVIDAAIDGLGKAVRALAGDPLGHAKGIAALTALRAACVQYYASRAYNELLRGMLADATAAPAAGGGGGYAAAQRRHLLAFLGSAVSSTRPTDSGGSLTLVNRDECPDETVVTDADSAAFVGQVEAAVTAARAGVGGAAPAAPDTGGGGGGEDEEYAFE